VVELVPRQLVPASSQGASRDHFPIPQQDGTRDNALPAASPTPVPDVRHDQIGNDLVLTAEFQRPSAAVRFDHCVTQLPQAVANTTPDNQRRYAT
jgi:hypothetical protein